MIKSAVTVSLVPEARGGPFIFWDDLPAACRRAKELGFDGIELFAPDAKTIERSDLRRLLDDHGLKLAAAGTGAGWVKHKLSLTSPDRSIREKAKDFVRSIIDVAAPLGAPAVVGSMQGRWGGDVDRDTALGFLSEAMYELARYSTQYQMKVLLEPLNRYETNLVNTFLDAVKVIFNTREGEIRLLADLFHMNIEEGWALPKAVKTVWVGHVHLADSNRHAAGFGHIDFAPIGQALCELRYDGYVSAEALPLPDSDTAARKTMETFRRFFPQVMDGGPPDTFCPGPPELE
jgi:sugar phosphate isomerase/epimerase